MVNRLSKMAGFNTQPPEGGWNNGKPTVTKNGGFNTQPPEGGWVEERYQSAIAWLFQHTAA